jgi:hypothetical protein
LPVLLFHRRHHKIGQVLTLQRLSNPALQCFKPDAATPCQPLQLAKFFPSLAQRYGDSRFCPRSSS